MDPEKTVDTAYLLVICNRITATPHGGAHGLYGGGAVFVLKPWPAAVTTMANGLAGGDLRELNMVKAISE
jgi:hypothetical protein